MKIEVDAFEFHKLVERDDKLNFLEAHGVDNWEGYDEAIREFREYRATLKGSN